MEWHLDQKLKLVRQKIFSELSQAVGNELQDPAALRHSHVLHFGQVRRLNATAFTAD